MRKKRIIFYRNGVWTYCLLFVQKNVLYCHACKGRFLKYKHQIFYHKKKREKKREVKTKYKEENPKCATLRFLIFSSNNLTLLT